MKIKLEILLDDKTEKGILRFNLLTFEFDDWIDFKDFLRKWFKHCTAKDIKAQINVHGDVKQK